MPLAPRKGTGPLPDADAISNAAAGADRFAPLEAGHDAPSPDAIPIAGWKRIGKRVIQALMSDKLWTNCACVGFFGFLSVFPILAIFVLLYGLAFDLDAVNAQIAVLEPLVPEMVFGLLADRLTSLATNSNSDLTLGLLISTGVALWTGSRGTNAMIDLLNLAYHEEASRSFVRRLMTAIALTIGGLIGLIVVLLTVAAIPIVVGNIPFDRTAELIALYARWPVLATLIFAGLTLLYRFAPNRRDARWRWLMPGAITGSVLWMALSVAFSIYVERFNDYGAMFGTLSVAVVMMLWVYYSALVIAIGAILNAEIELQTRRDSTVGPPKPRGQRGAVVADALPPPEAKQEPKEA
ncbi:YihY/virulence factor BrkB family protein [Jannaschia sp. LMIT008]|uniref:YihY/virulence factor BrkB family protein n=1 Tax=Jannaschia maritima TaxID=3032585 RepID=UPI002812866A|nr:YihY/virulence factor BrkB family protein [Jannaschia sp. LMIT008]